MLPNCVFSKINYMKLMEQTGGQPRAPRLGHWFKQYLEETGWRVGYTNRQASKELYKLVGWAPAGDPQLRKSVCASIQWMYTGGETRQVWSRYRCCSSWPQTTQFLHQPSWAFTSKVIRKYGKCVRGKRGLSGGMKTIKIWNSGFPLILLFLLWNLGKVWLI